MSLCLRVKNIISQHQYIIEQHLRACALQFLGGRISVARLSASVLLVVMVAFPSLSFAHARLSPSGTTPPRTDQDNIKNRQDPRASDYCGVTRADGQPVTHLTSGAELDVVWEARIYHRGYFRVALSRENDSNFDEFILLDNYPESPSMSTYRQTVTLPNIECAECTLQLIQVMEDRNPPTNYYSCANVVLQAGSTGDSTPPASVANMMADGLDSSARVTWQNPAEDFAGVLLVRSTSVHTPPVSNIAYQEDDALGAGVVVYRGMGQEALLTSLVNGQQYSITAYAFDSAFNYSEPANVIVTPLEQNIAPSVSLLYENVSGKEVQKFGGYVVVKAAVVDDNADDTHTYDWTQTDPALIDLDSEASTLTFDPEPLLSRTYSVHVRVVDSGEPPLADTASDTLTLVENNIAPDVQVEVWQGETQSALVKANREDIRWLVSIQDKNASDTHQVSWVQVSGSTTINGISYNGREVILPSSGLLAGQYEFLLTVQDDGLPPQEASLPVRFEVRRARIGHVGFYTLSLFFGVLLLSGIYTLIRRYNDNVTI